MSPRPPRYSYKISYDHVAWIYDGLARLYSGGGIGRSKFVQNAWVEPDMRMLIAGVGTGEEVPRLLQAGVKLTCVDASGRMLRKLSRRLDEMPPSLRERATLVCDDVLALEATSAYDIVSANYFLDLYAEASMREALARLVLQLHPQGRLLIADFMPAYGADFANRLQRLYYRLPEIGAALFRLAQWHPLYDYRRYLSGAGLALESEVFLPALRGLPLGFVSLVAHRMEPMEPTP